MTLSTHVAIGPGIPAREVFTYCRALLNTPDSVPIEEGPSDEHPGWSHRAGQRWLNHPCGVGLDAWLWLHYGPDGPMVHHPCEECGDPEHDEWVAGDPTENGQAAIDVDLDTAYGYRGPTGESCSALHARLVAQLGAWLDERGVTWWWKNEYTGEWHANDAAGRAALAEFGGEHTKPGGADEWFRSMVLPAIESGTILHRGPT